MMCEFSPQNLFMVKPNVSNVCIYTSIVNLNAILCNLMSKFDKNQ